MTKKQLQQTVKNLHEFNAVTYHELERVRKYHDIEANRRYLDLLDEQQMVIRSLQRELTQYKTAYEDCADCLSSLLSTDGAEVAPKA